jgi:hypothetical protein
MGVVHGVSESVLCTAAACDGQMLGLQLRDSAALGVPVRGTGTCSL